MVAKLLQAEPEPEPELTAPRPVAIKPGWAQRVLKVIERDFRISIFSEDAAGAGVRLMLRCGSYGGSAYRAGARLMSTPRWT